AGLSADGRRALGRHDGLHDAGVRDGDDKSQVGRGRRGLDALPAAADRAGAGGDDPAAEEGQRLRRPIMRESLSIPAPTYPLLALFVFMVAVPLFWMLTTALKSNKELYEDFSYLPHRPTLEHFVRVIRRDGLLTNIWNSFAVASVTTAVTVVVSAFAAFSIVRSHSPAPD